ncbi:2,3-diphosphoglycerate-dependent phosphoglycerate mutase [Erysipelothrix urinaevulpis]|uniref:2,3-diphosphoglycerate-dependent phosphoglycerate mutase n=1 Tax=Erysipelothrix urinaevulpis TaxID=2683717 RepID=UPI00135A5901|nr:2,3-diphosphoglycerate-dependent phosphoglycerate mutase [Erysipelothrix urinaevulpis]
MKLVIIRHGESLWNKKNLFTGWTDVELSNQGINEAKQAGQRLLDQNFSFDIAYTSTLKRAIHTLDIILNEMNLVYIPVIKDYHLNERHYGALQGLNKQETAEKYGDEQVLIWRRSFDVKPPALTMDDPRAPRNQSAYQRIDEHELPLTESLKETIQRVVPYFESTIKPQIIAGENVIIAAHGNSIRALMKYFLKISDTDIISLNIPTGVPLIIEFDENFNVINHHYLDA